MAEQAGDKTHEATPHRREEARGKGQVAFSQDLGSAALLLAGTLLLMLLGGRIAQFAGELLTVHLGQVGYLVPDERNVMWQAQRTLAGMAKVLVPFLGLLFVASALASILQVGFLWVPQRLAPDVSRLNPASGLQRIFSLAGTMRLGFGLFKVVVVSGVAAAALWLRADEILRSPDLEMGPLARFVADITLQTVIWIAVALAVLALLDYAFQRWKYEQDLRMTHQEMQEELKNLQGDPQVIARRRAVQRQLALNRLSSTIPEADVVVTNPTELAVAIKYQPEEMAAPIVVAKGAGVIAQRIRRLALEHGIPVVERKPLARLLFSEVDVNHPIPGAAYAAVAEVLAYVYQLKGKKIPGTLPERS